MNFIRARREELSVPLAIKEAREIIEMGEVLKVEYLEIVDERTLQPKSDWSNPERIRIFVAANVDRVRLIDNMKFY
jgi:pantothenate synthetase